MISQSIYEKLVVQVNLIENELEKQKLDLPELVQPLYTYAIGGGRRFRGLLVFLGYSLVSVKYCKNLVSISAIVELIHKASLIHDDIIDNDNFRRGRDSFHKKYSPQIGIISADLLFGQALKIANDIQGLDPVIHLRCYSLISKTVRDLSIGELEELLLNIDETTISKAIAIDQMKAGSLTSASLTLGCLLGEGNEAQITNAMLVGQILGELFQMVNDFNNISGTELKNRRKRYSDLQLGKCTSVIAIGTAALKKLGMHDLIENIKYPSATCEDYQKFFEVTKPYIDDYLKLHIRQSIEKLNSLLYIFPDGKAKELILKVATECQQSWFWENC